MTENQSNSVCVITKFNYNGETNGNHGIGNDLKDSKMPENNEKTKTGDNVTKSDAENEDLSHKELKKQKMRIWLNLLCLFFANSFVSFGRMYIINATTSLMTDAKKAATGQTIMGFMQFFGAMLFLTPVAKLFKIKTLISIGLFCSSTLIVVFYYPTSAVFYTGSFVAGIGLSVLLGSSFGYGNTLAYWYHKLTKKDLRILMFLTSGIFYASFSGGFLTGNLIFSAVFYPDIMVSNNTDKSLCGVNYCGQELNSTTLISTSDSNYIALLTTFTVVALIGSVLSLFLLDVSGKKKVSDSEKKSSWTLMKDLLMMAKDTQSLLLAVTSVMIGMQQAFLMSGYTKAFVTCSLGISKVGYVMMGYGISLILMPFLFWPMVKILGRLATLIIGFVDTVAFYFILLFWPIENYSGPLFFCLALMMGVSSSLFISFSTATYASLFNKHINESQFLANFWRSCGLIVNYNTNIFLCTNTILYVQVVITTVSVLLLFVLEGIIKKNSRKIPDK